jgi:class 3 adenylate cyclase
MAGTRKIAAILVADIVGYSRLAAADEERTLTRLRGLRSDLIDPAIAAHHDRVVKRTGDGALVELRLANADEGPQSCRGDEVEEERKQRLVADRIGSALRSSA